MLVSISLIRVSTTGFRGRKNIRAAKHVSECTSSTSSTSSCFLSVGVWHGFIGRAAMPRSPARSSHARSRAAAAQDAPGIQDKNHSRGATQEASAGGSSRSETSHELRFVQSCGIFHLLCINTRMAEIKNRQVQTLGVWLLRHPVELTPHQPRH